MKQSECRQEFLELCQYIKKRIGEIDKETPADGVYNLEPEWWLMMMTIEKEVSQTLDKLESESLTKPYCVDDKVWKKAEAITTEPKLHSTPLEIIKLLVLVKGKKDAFFGWYSPKAERWYLENSPSVPDITHYMETPKKQGWK